MSDLILDKALATWNIWSEFRARRSHSARFTYGEQWCDYVADPNNPAGPRIREDRAIENTGRRPYTNNLIRQLVKTVVGRYRTHAAEANIYSGDIADIAHDNALAEIDARMLEEFLISGAAIQRITAERRWQGAGVWVDNVSPERFFVNPFRDPRGWDIELIGQTHDMTLAQIINRFAQGDRTRAADFGRIYARTDDPIGLGRPDADTFLWPASAGKCRVIEVWTYESRPVDPDSAFSDFVWHCRWFAPDGTVLAEYDSPYPHRSHPFAVKLYPLTDGEIHSFVEDVIDQQKFINRLIVTLDHMLACSAKGVLLFPIDQKPHDQDWSYIASRWSRTDGVIPITGRGAMPQQITGNGASNGAHQLLQLQMQLFEKVSGVGDALYGRDNGSARGADFLDSQIKNAQIALADLFDTFTSFITTRNTKALTTI